MSSGCHWGIICHGIGGDEDPPADNFNDSAAPPGDCPLNQSELGLNANGASSAANQEYGPAVGCATCWNGLGLALLRALRSDLLLTANGRMLVSLYYFHSYEMMGIIRGDPTVRTLVANTVNDFMPAVRSYLYNDINGTDFILTDDKLSELQAVADALKANGSAGLRSDLDQFMTAARAQRNKKMSDAIRGLRN